MISAAFKSEKINPRIQLSQPRSTALNNFRISLPTRCSSRATTARISTKPAIFRTVSDMLGKYCRSHSQAISEKWKASQMPRMTETRETTWEINPCWMPRTMAGTKHTSNMMSRVLIICCKKSLD